MFPEGVAMSLASAFLDNSRLVFPMSVYNTDVIDRYLNVPGSPELRSRFFCRHSSPSSEKKRKRFSEGLFLSHVESEGECECVTACIWY